MLYLLAIPPIIVLIIVLTWQWFSTQMREFAHVLHVRRRLRAGGRTPEKLIAETRTAFQAEGLEPDVIIVPHDALDLYDRLRERVIGQSDRPDLPAAVVLVLAADVSAGKLYLRAADTPPDRAGCEVAGFHEFSRVSNIDHESNTGDFEGIACAAEECLAIQIDAGEPQHYRLAIEAAWHTEPRDLALLFERITHDRQPPATTPLILR